MTKEELHDALAVVRTHHPVHAMPWIVRILAELIARVPEGPAPRAGREHPHKRFVPIDVTRPGKESA